MALRRPTWRGLVFYGGILLVWAVGSYVAWWPRGIFPDPRAVLAALARGLGDTTYLVGLWSSLRRILLGYGLSVVLGILIGVATGRVRWLRDTVGSLVTALWSLPSIAWLPLTLLWFGPTEQALYFIVVNGGLLSIAVSTSTGVQQIPPLYLRAARNLGAGPGRVLWQVVVPAALPSILIGLKQGWAFAWRGLMAGELLFVHVGLGRLLRAGQEAQDLGGVVAVMLMIVAVGLVVDRFVFGRFERWIQTRWGLAGG